MAILIYWKRKGEILIEIQDLLRKRPLGHVDMVFPFSGLWETLLLIV